MSLNDSKRKYSTQPDYTKKSPATPLVKKYKPSASDKYSFSFIPDPSLYQGGTWREEEILGHNSLAYPCAEIIDNALNATEGLKERQIDIFIIEKENSEFNFVVCDNGKGMGIEGLQNLAIYAHAPQFRNGSSVLDTKMTKNIRYINSCISRFGVGLKNAAFHMGDDVTVITKEKFSKEVLEFNMNIKKMREKYKEKRATAYKGKVSKRLQGDFSNSILEKTKPSKSIREIIKNEKDKPHFTTIVISMMSDQHKENLKSSEKRQNLARNLASLYHYYLNGVHGKSKATANKKKTQNGPFVNINMSFLSEVENEGNKETIDLKLIDDDVQTLNQKYFKGVPFEFELVLPNKDPVVGVIFYYPFENDAETIPPFTHRNYSINKTPLSNDEEQEENEEKVRNFKKDNKNALLDPIFNCFWQGRQIPFSSVSILNFMLSVEPYLRRRMRGALFFNESFPVNPQKNIFNIDLNETLNISEAKIVNIKDQLPDFSETTTRRSKRPKTTKDRQMQIPSKRFAFWAKTMSSEYDKEFEYKNEIDDKTMKFFRVFKTAIYGKVTFQKEDLIKIYAGNGIYHFGEIHLFYIRSNSDGMTKYKRLPKEIYGDTLLTRATRNIVRDLTKSEFSKQLKIMMEKTLEDYPKKLIFLHDTGIFKNMDTTIRENVPCGYTFPDCYIKILTVKNGIEEQITYIQSQDNKKIMLTIIQIMEKYDKKTKKWILDEKINGINEYQCVPLNQKYHELGAYYFKPVKMRKIGKFRIIFAVKLKSKLFSKEWILSKTFNLNVNIGPPVKFTLPAVNLDITVGKENEFYNTIIPVELKNCQENIFNYDPKFEFQTKFALFRNDKNLSKIIKINSDLNYYEDIKKYCLCNFTAVVLEKYKIDFKGLKCKLEVKIKLNDSSFLKNSLNVNVFPGIPKEIILISPVNIKVSNHTILKNVKFSLNDEYGNITHSTFGIDNLIIEWGELSGNKWPNKDILEKLQSKKSIPLFEISNIQVSLKKEEMLNTNSEKGMQIPFMVYATKNRTASTVIKPVRSHFTVIPSRQVCSILLTSNLEDFVDSEMPVLQIELGVRNRIYVRFIDEFGDVSDNVKVEDISKFKAKLNSGTMCGLSKDENENLMIKFEAPTKMDGSRNCWVECVLKSNPTNVIRKNFRIEPIYSEPSKWDLDFADSIKCGSKLKNVLAVYLLDKFGNRMNMSVFEDPLNSNPVVESTATLEQMELDIDLKNDCFYFPKGVIKGTTGRHSIKVLENVEYEFNASNQFDFVLLPGPPEDLEVSVLKENRQYREDEIIECFSFDNLIFESTIVDCFGNAIDSINNVSVKADLESDLFSKQHVRSELRNGKCRNTLPIRVKSGVLKTPVDVEAVFSVKYSKKTIKVIKFLKIMPTPFHVINLIISNNIKNAIIENQPPLIGCKVFFEGEEKVAKLDGFAEYSVEVSGSASEQKLYSKPFIDKEKENMIFFKPAVETFPNTGRYSFRVLYKETRAALPNVVMSNPVFIEVFPGHPKKLIIMKLEDFDSLSASNYGNCRIIAKNVPIGFCDKNNITLKPDQRLGKFPKLNVKIDGDVNDKSCLPEIKYNITNPMHIDYIEIVEKTGTFQGKCKLVISVDENWIKKNDTIYNSLQPAILPFYFSNDANRISKQKELESKKQKIAQNIQKLSKLLEPFHYRDKKLSKIESILKLFEEKFPEYSSLPSKQAAVKFFNQNVERLEMRIQENNMGSSLPSFKATITGMSGYIGRVGDLISVENVDIARCVMYLLGSRSYIHLTRSKNSPATRESVRMLKRHRDFSCLDVDLLPKRNFAIALKNNTLPHEGHFELNSAIKPVFAVKTLQKRSGIEISQEEFERVFVYFLSSALIMDNLESAIDYERKCIEKKIYCSKIVTKDGFDVQLVKKSIPSFDQMRHKKRSISIFPSAAIKELKALNETFRPELDKYFNLKKEKMIEEKKKLEESSKRAAIEADLDKLQKSRAEFLKLMQKMEK